MGLSRISIGPAVLFSFFLLSSLTVPLVFGSPILWNQTYGMTPHEASHGVIEISEAPQILWNRTISEWNKTAGKYIRSFAKSIIQASDGGFVVIGGSNGSSTGDWYDWWLVKTDSNANVEWEKTFGGPYQDFAHSIIQTSDGGYAIAGTMNDKTTVVKTDSEGNTQWKRTYSESIHASIIQTSDAGYIIACGERGLPKSFFESLFGEPDHFQLVKTDDSGYESWKKTYGEGTAYSVIQTNDGGYALFGSSSSTRLMFVKTDSLGNLEWQKTYGSVDDYGIKVVQNSDNAFVLFGMLTVDRRCPGLIKIDVEGNILWAKNYLRDRAIPSDMVGTSDGGYIFCGTEEWTITEGDVYGELVKVDSEGNISWVISFVEDYTCMSVIQTSDGGYALLNSAVRIIKIEKDSTNPEPTVSPTSTHLPELKPTTDSFPTSLIIATASTVTIAVGLLVYFKKRKH